MRVLRAILMVATFAMFVTGCASSRNWTHEGTLSEVDAKVRVQQASRQLRPSVQQEQLTPSEPVSQDDDPVLEGFSLAEERALVAEQRRQDAEALRAQLDALLAQTRAQQEASATTWTPAGGDTLSHAFFGGGYNRTMGSVAELAAKASPAITNPDLILAGVTYTFPAPPKGAIEIVRAPRTVSVAVAQVPNVPAENPPSVAPQAQPIAESSVGAPANTGAIVGPAASAVSTVARQGVVSRSARQANPTAEPTNSPNPNVASNQGAAEPLMMGILKKELSAWRWSAMIAALVVILAAVLAVLLPRRKIKSLNVTIGEQNELLRREEVAKGTLMRERNEALNIQRTQRERLDILEGSERRLLARVEELEEKFRKVEPTWDRNRELEALFAKHYIKFDLGEELEDTSGEDRKEIYLPRVPGASDGDGVPLVFSPAGGRMSADRRKIMQNFRRNPDILKALELRFKEKPAPEAVPQVSPTVDDLENSGSHLLH